VDRAVQREILLHGSIEVEGRVAGSSNNALLVTLELDGIATLACYKPEAGERPLWDFPDGLWRREVAAFELDAALDTDLIPTTVEREDGPFGVGSFQWWIEHAEGEHYFTLREREEHVEWFADLCAYDVVANNAERKSGHVLYDGTRCWAIDHGLCFHEEDKLRTVIWEFSGMPIRPALLERLERFARGEVGELGRYLSRDELVATRARARHLVASSAYPTPDLEGDWPPYPWPLV
jgi:hypothetical protein